MIQKSHLIKVFALIAFASPSFAAVNCQLSTGAASHACTCKDPTGKMATGTMNCTVTITPTCDYIEKCRPCSACDQLRVTSSTSPTASTQNQLEPALIPDQAQNSALEAKVKESMKTK